MHSACAQAGRLLCASRTRPGIPCVLQVKKEPQCCSEEQHSLLVVSTFVIKDCFSECAVDSCLRGIVCAVGAVPLYGQCGGTGFEGPTACDNGGTCEFRNEYYSQVSSLLPVATIVVATL